MLSPNTQKASGIRDKAILELLYSTGIRRTELCNLEMVDLSLGGLTVFVRKGKGGKDRLLPLGERAAKWIQHYLDHVRTELLLSIHEPHVFLTDYGEPFSESRLGDKVKRYLRKSEIDVPGSCHLLRHAMATHMMENGADIRYIQAMLGHSDLSTTEIYTHVSIRKLQEVHAATHPARLEDRNALLEQLQIESDAELESE
jgi:integrase/recombinase XerD